VFPNPVGLAAGLDKNGAHVDALLALGFGFVEVGTVTPLPQQGNPRPRMFRLTADHAVINRLGFNNEGHDVVFARLKARAGTGVLGINIGANKDSTDRVADYVAGVERFAGLADYLTINVSSPNTPGLRKLQEKSALSELLAAVSETRDRPGGLRTPLFLKIAPDLTEAELAGIADAALASGIEGMIVSNTTISRDGLPESRRSKEEGGLSGRPLFRRSTIVLAKLRRLVGRRLVIVGVGGVDSAEAAFAKIAAGADLVQLYTGLIFEGPGLPARVLNELVGYLDRHRFPSIADAVGVDTDLWAAANP